MPIYHLSMTQADGRTLAESDTDARDLAAAITVAKAIIADWAHNHESVWVEVSGPGEDYWHRIVRCADGETTA